MRIVESARKHREVQDEGIDGRSIENHTGASPVDLGDDHVQSVFGLLKADADGTPVEGVGPGMSRCIPHAAVVGLSPTILALR